MRAIDRGPIADLYALHVCDIEHGDIHGDDSDDRHELPAQQHAPAISQRTVDAVSVPRRQHADARRPLGHIRRVVTTSLPPLNMAKPDNPRADDHYSP